MARRRKNKTNKTKSLPKVLEDKQNTSSDEQARDQQAESRLPTELLQDIISQLSLKDNIRASAVCKQWQALAISVRRADKPPWLMCFTSINHMYELYDPLHRRTHWLELPELQDSRICYAREGWLLVNHHIHQTVFFYHPYTREKIDLPAMDLVSQTVAFSSAPTSSSCTVIVVKAYNLAAIAVSMCQPGDSRWTTVNYQTSAPFDSSLWDKIVPFNGLFYCLSVTGWLGVYDPEKWAWSGDSIPPPRRLDNLTTKNWWKGKFMAEHNGDIYVVYTCFSVNPVIYKLDQANRTWVEMNKLAGMSLFVSYLSCFARTDLLGSMRNNVYFPKVRFCGKRCSLYSFDDCRYYPGNKAYNWEEQKPYESAWVDPPQDLSIFL